MQGVFALLLAVEAIIVTVAVYLGLEADSAASTLEHVKVGLLAAVYNMFLHCLMMFYLIGAGKDIKKTIEGFPDLQRVYVPLTRRLKKRVFPLATFSILSILLASFAGAWVHSEMIAAHGRANPATGAAFALREVPGWWIHLAILIPALALNFLTFVVEVRVIRDNVRTIRRLNGELAEIFGAATAGSPREAPESTPGPGGRRSRGLDSTREDG